MWVTKVHRKKDKTVSWSCHFKVLEQKGYYWSSLVIKTDFFAQKDVIYSTCLQSGCTPQEELRIRKRFYLQNHLACLLHRGLGGFYNWNIKNNKRPLHRWSKTYESHVRMMFMVLGLIHFPKVSVGQLFYWHCLFILDFSCTFRSCMQMQPFSNIYTQHGKDRTSSKWVGV